MKPIVNTTPLPKIGNAFRARSGALYLCRALKPCESFIYGCKEANYCTGYRAKINETQSWMSAYCVLKTWYPKE